MILLLAGCSSAAPTEPTSQQIKASAVGRMARANIKATGKTPDETQCQAAWDNLLDWEQKELRHTVWMQVCVDPGTP
ncbi:hypothetical protein [Streptomyces sp. 1222.5]|uniref:hypothetical protein n=1 Tax=Streptomyces sp. 1222.5 TaxID=1881026 RepID=UPI003D73894F